ncbi:MAG: hypothetical protein EHM72_21190, partial [Calditrichaeota bacterium]
MKILEYSLIQPAVHRLIDLINELVDEPGAIGGESVTTMFCTFNHPASQPFFDQRLDPQLDDYGIVDAAAHELNCGGL